ncbi:MAG: tRNA (N6-isopentenyl adenosine(37)-C2)-methylthiotransferase MiaB [Desulfuromonadaceae bacterium]|nr:tRNA (N6-isopentenyl adenosine(37)-C2)-methylthiotransferase MiaB [Desulfuromonas sp.]MDY0185026.1 tRNA (N6-isopentenyl adenosine(37)-C2)-methylthiotransferase MiaB [Desulfuromonadaceae bacterium]
MKNTTCKRFYLETFGCQMNVVDSEWIATLIGDLGYQQIDAPQDADLIILNTCSVREKAERKVYGHLGSFKPLKDKNPALILAVGGCVAQQEKERLLERVPYLDIVFGTHNVHQLGHMVRSVEASRQRRCETAFNHSAARFDTFPQRSGASAVNKFVTIVQGCDNYCTYCIVPYVRGREVSRGSAEILAEIESLVQQGVREITLLGQNVNSYGQGNATGNTNANPNSNPTGSFTELLHAVHAIDGLERIRFFSSHPKDFSLELMECFRTLPKVCPQMHLALQSGSNRILQAMNRGYTREDFLANIDQLRSSCPQIRFSTDVIVGFPGETREDFLDTVALLDEVGFGDVFTFLYSPRPETKAAQYDDPISKEEKHRWFEELLARQRQISVRVWGGDVGTTQEVLVEGKSRHGSGQLFGRNLWNRIVNFNGPEKLIGRMVQVQITRSMNNSHLGELAATNVLIPQIHI